nr:membrane protein b162 [Mastomys natalensis cytomegalovirus 3]WEG69978.1 membrane protein b162 [Mastomys natalensis cytomegalovirus 3]WEG70118.1 membrane protein b162 [Mastomys natalensis cytomegalovirus 3]WEG70258.1 membrane protein b162 [Mastomys natalensis cytomegalovirus 3]WEG70398.1 membrane protein b162 [Mastomys natalensis cytomegalovirus 3]
MMNRSRRLTTVLILCSALHTILCLEWKKGAIPITISFNVVNETSVRGSLAIIHAPFTLTFEDERISHACKACPDENELGPELQFIKRQKHYLLDMIREINRDYGYVVSDIYLLPNDSEYTTFYGASGCLFKYNSVNNVNTKEDTSKCNITYLKWNKTDMEEFLANDKELWIKWKKVMEDNTKLAALKNVNISFWKSHVNNKTIAICSVESDSTRRFKIYLSTNCTVQEKGGYNHRWTNGYSEAVHEWQPHMMCTVSVTDEWITNIIRPTERKEYLDLLPWDWGAYYETCKVWPEEKQKPCWIRAKGERIIVIGDDLSFMCTIVGLASFLLALTISSLYSLYSDAVKSYVEELYCNRRRPSYTLLV